MMIGFLISFSYRRPDYCPRLSFGWKSICTSACPPTSCPSCPEPLTRYLAELKVKGTGSSRYPGSEAGSRNKQVDRRARGLPADYQKKLAAIDRARGTLQREQLVPWFRDWCLQ